MRISPQLICYFNRVKRSEQEICCITKCKQNIAKQIGNWKREIASGAFLVENDKSLDLKRPRNGIFYCCAT